MSLFEWLLLILADLVAVGILWLFEWPVWLAVSIIVLINVTSLLLH